MFKKAEREQSKLRLCISGPSGSGKTLGALTIAKVIAEDKRIAVIDTENGSASLYSDKFDFDVLNLEAPYSPSRFVTAIKTAEKEGYGVIVIDSATHEWDGMGGCLDMNEKTARAKFKGNTWSAWSDTTAEHQKFIDAITHSKCHIICTARSKTESSQVDKKIVRLGTKLVQRDNFEYEFTVALDLVHDGHFASPLKDRTGLFSGEEIMTITEETGKALLKWLKSGKVHDETDQKVTAEIESQKTGGMDSFSAELAIAKCNSLEDLRTAWEPIFLQFDKTPELAELTDIKNNRKRWLMQDNKLKAMGIIPASSANEE